MTKSNCNKWDLVRIIALLVVGATGVSAQSTQHSHYPNRHISGAEHPEQIPITLILRHWLAYNTAKDTINIDFVGLHGEDKQALIGLMADFRKQWNYANKKRNAVAGTDLDSYDQQQSFWRDREKLVARFWQRIQVELSSVGLIQFTNYLNGQKTMLQVSPFDYGLGEDVAERNIKESQMYASSALPQGLTMTPNYSFYRQDTPVVNSLADSFQFANATVLGSGGDTVWVPTAGQFVIEGDQAKHSTPPGGYATAYYNDPNGASVDQCNTIKIGTVPTTLSIQVLARVNTAGTAFYMGQYYNGQLRLVAYQNNQWPILGAKSYAPASGDLITMCAIGSTISTFATSGHGVVASISVTDTSITAAGFPGIEIDDSVATITGFMASTDMQVQVGASIMGNTSCSPSCPKGALHTPSITIGTQTQNGQAVPPTNEIDFAYDLDDPLGGYSDPSTIIGAVDCSVVGGIWSAGGGGSGQTGLQAEEAQTTLKISSVGPPYATTTYCNTYTTPPDLRGTPTEPSYVAPYNDITGPCTRNWTTVIGKGTVFTAWACPVEFGIFEDGDPGLQKCSAWDKGCEGVILWNSYNGTPKNPPTNTQCY